VNFDITPTEPSQYLVWHKGVIIILLPSLFSFLFLSVLDLFRSRSFSSLRFGSFSSGDVHNTDAAAPSTSLGYISQSSDATFYSNFVSTKTDGDTFRIVWLLRIYSSCKVLAVRHRSCTPTTSLLRVRSSRLCLISHIPCHQYENRSLD
jgi:hypothetical protein